MQGGCLMPVAGCCCPSPSPGFLPGHLRPDSDVPLWMDTWVAHSFTRKGAHGHQLHTSQVPGT